MSGDLGLRLEMEESILDCTPVVGQGVHTSQSCATKPTSPEGRVMHLTYRDTKRKKVADKPSNSSCSVRETLAHVKLKKLCLRNSADIFEIIDPDALGSRIETLQPLGLDKARFVDREPQK